jgi:hypothetical protein
MISDILFDSAERIRKYLHDFPESYDEGRTKRITKLLGDMDAICEDLDTPPGWQRLGDAVGEIVKKVKPR